jgi:hypothetical protein
MTDTPRTDAGCFDSFEHPVTEQNCEVVAADLARTLERELAAMTERVAELEAALEQAMPQLIGRPYLDAQIALKETK